MHSYNILFVIHYIISLHPTPALHCPTLINCIVLHPCTVLYFIKLILSTHCTVSYSPPSLHCTVLHCTALSCTVLHCPALHCTVYYSYSLPAVPRLPLPWPQHGYNQFLILLSPSGKNTGRTFRSIVLHCISLHCTVMNCSAMKNTAPSVPG